MFISQELLDKIHDRGGKEHPLSPQELDALKSTIHQALDNAALVMAKKTYFLDSDGKEYHAAELRIIIKLQARDG